MKLVGKTDTIFWKLLFDHRKMYVTKNIYKPRHITYSTVFRVYIQMLKTDHKTRTTKLMLFHVAKQLKYVVIIYYLCLKMYSQ